MPQPSSVTKREILSCVEHRQDPLPDGPWIMFQRWHDILFAHWPLMPEALRGRLPEGLELDLYDGLAWIGILPLRLSGVRLRGTPPLPGLSSFCQLNVRTYVRQGDRRGLWFFSLDTGNRVVARLARMLARLPYFDAQMKARATGGAVDFRSLRPGGAAPAAEFRVRYSPAGEAGSVLPGSLDDFLTSRYCVFATKPNGTLLRTDAHHLPWLLQPVRADFTRNSLAAAAGLDLPARDPVLHFARTMDVLFWRPRPA